MKTAALATTLVAGVSAAASAQYPLTPSPALDFTTLSNALTPSGYAAVRQTLLSDTNTFSIQRARFTVEARPVPIAAVRIQADFASLDSASGSFLPSFTLTDAYIQLSPPESSATYRRFRPALLVGQFKTPFSLEYLTSYALLLTANRSQAVDSLSTRRDIGVMGQAQAWDRIILAGAVVNGAGSDHPTNPNGKEMVIGRMTLVPLRNRLAVAGKWLGDGDDHRWGADVRWFSDPRLLPGSLIVEGEWIRQEGSVTPGTSTDGSGGYGVVLWRALPWLEPVVKWERLRERHTTNSTQTERRARWVTYGVVLRSPEPAEHLRIQMNWVTKRETPENAKNQLLTQLIMQF